MAKITIPIITPSLNELLRMHYRNKTKLKKSLISHIEGAIFDMRDDKGNRLEIAKMTKPQKRSIRIYSFRKNSLDPDNLIGGSQPLINAIKELGLIWDDSEKYIDLKIKQIEYPEQKTVIFIENAK